MKADMDPELEVTVIRLLHVLAADTRVQPWPSPTARVEQVVRRQRRVRTTVGAAGLAFAVAASVVGVAVAAGSPGRVKEPVGGVGTSVPATAVATSAPLALQPSSVGVGGAVGATSAPAVGPADSTPIPATALPALRAIAWRQAALWGDLAARITAVHLSHSAGLAARIGSTAMSPPELYAIEVAGRLSCSTCGLVGADVQNAAAVVVFVDPRTMREIVLTVSATVTDLAAYGVVTTMPPPDPTAVSPSLPAQHWYVKGDAITLAAAEQFALEGADDPTTARVLWTREVPGADLRRHAPGLIAADQLFYVIGVAGAQSPSGSAHLDKWEELVPAVYAGSYSCTTYDCWLPWPEGH